MSFAKQILGDLLFAVFVLALMAATGFVAHVTLRLL